MRNTLGTSVALLALASVAAGAQTLKITAVTGTTADITTSTMTISASHLSSSATGYGNVMGQLKSVILMPQGVSMGQPIGSSIWLVGSLAAGYYHVRFNFTVQSATGISSLTIHNGQLASDPVLFTCTITNSACDVILSWPGGNLSLLGVVGGQYWSFFSNITVTPTKL